MPDQIVAAVVTQTQAVAVQVITQPQAVAVQVNLGVKGDEGDKGGIGPNGVDEVSPTPPLDPLEGDRWFNSVTGLSYTFYDGVWVSNSAGAAYVPHASMHAAGGDDPITPASIGAAATNHNHAGVYQPVDANLVSVATPADGDMIQRVGGSWVTRTIAQIKTALGLGSAAYTASTDYAAASHAHGGVYQTVDANLVSVATPADGDMIQRVGGSWVTRTLAAVISGSTTKATIADADEAIIADSAAAGAGKKVTYSTIWAWIKSRIDAGLTWAGNHVFTGTISFTSTTRPTSGATGAPSDNSMILYRDTLPLLTVGGDSTIHALPNGKYYKRFRCTIDLATCGRNVWVSASPNCPVGGRAGSYKVVTNVAYSFFITEVDYGIYTVNHRFNQFGVFFFNLIGGFQASNIVGIPSVTSGDVITGSYGSKLVSTETKNITAAWFGATLHSVQIPTIGEIFTVTGGSFKINSNGASSSANAAQTICFYKGSFFIPSALPTYHDAPLIMTGEEYY